MAADIETGVTLGTDITAQESDSPQDRAPTIVVIPTVHDANDPGTPVECQLNLEQTQDSHAPKDCCTDRGRQSCPSAQPIECSP